MPDPYLEAMMRGEFNKKPKSSAPTAPKDKFDLVIEKQINAYIDSLNLENEYGRNLLVTPAMKRMQPKQELREEAKLTELKQYIDLALAILCKEGALYIDPDERERLFAEFTGIGAKIDQPDFNTLSGENFQTIFKISNESMEAMMKIAVAKFTERVYLSSLAVTVLLSTLDPVNPDYWFRIGMIAQQSDNIDLALRAYAMAIDLDPALIGARLFSVECHLQGGRREDAELEFLEAKKIADSGEIEAEWLDFLSKIGDTIHPS